jgi:acetyl esterase/lipase
VRAQLAIVGGLLPVLVGAPTGTGTGGGPPSASPAACRSRTLPVPAGAPPRQGTVLRGAPAYAELTMPAGSPRGVVVLLHGGGWADVGAGGVAAMRPEARRWQRRGWVTLNATYRPCAASIADALSYYDTAARGWPDLPVCAIGGSSGGHLALGIAAQRPGLDCAIAEGAPVDLTSLTRQSAYDPAGGGAQTAGPRFVRDLAVNAFGAGNLERFSVARPPGRPATRYLVVTSRRDPYVPFEQATDFAAAVRAAGGSATALQLAPGAHPFTHAPVSAAAWRAYRRAVVTTSAGA